MLQFGFYRVGSEVRSPLSIIDATSVDDAKRQARAALEAEGLDAIRLWVEGQQTIEVRKPVRPTPIATRTEAEDRGAQMAARRAAGAKMREIAAEFGISKERVGDLIAQSDQRARIRAEQPNRAALSVRARNALPHIIDEPETDPVERDRRLPARVAALTRRQVEKVPNLGKQTVVELDAWLWERGLTFNG